MKVFIYLRTLLTDMFWVDTYVNYAIRYNFFYSDIKFYDTNVAIIDYY